MERATIEPLFMDVFCGRLRQTGDRCMNRFPSWWQQDDGRVVPHVAEVVNTSRNAPKTRRVEIVMPYFPKDARRFRELFRYAFWCHPRCGAKYTLTARQMRRMYSDAIRSGRDSISLAG